MKNRPIRILQITGGMNMGGIENFIMNIYRNIDRNKIQFDFLIHQEEKQMFEDEINFLGGKVFRIPSLAKVGHFKYLKGLRDFFLSHQEYQIIHSHYNTISGIILKEARKCSIKNRISHSHTAYPKYKLLESIYKNYSKYLLRKNATEYLACSKEAGEWLYGKNKKFKIIKNGIDINKFLFDEKIRKSEREKLGMKEFSILCLGRLSKEKNHMFLLEVMEEINKKEKDITLYIVGMGILENQLKQEVKNRKLENVKFLGVQKEVYKLLNAMDLMVFPSIYEGLGIVAIESQSNGLTVLASENIPDEADMKAGLFYKFNLSSGAEKWARKILELKSTIVRKKIKEQEVILLKSEYNIKKIVQEIENLYLEKYKRREN